MQHQEEGSTSEVPYERTDNHDVEKGIGVDAFRKSTSVSWLARPWAHGSGLTAHSLRTHCALTALSFTH
jgi:hypothetical protein